MVIGSSRGRGIKVAGDLQIRILHVSINGFHQFPHIGGILVINSISLALDQGSKSRAGDMFRVPQLGVPGHSHCLKGSQPTLFKPLSSGLKDDRLHEILSVRETFVVPFVLACLQSYLKVGHFFSIGRVQAFSLR